MIWNKCHEGRRKDANKGFNTRNRQKKIGIGESIGTGTELRIGKSIGTGAESRRGKSMGPCKRAHCKFKMLDKRTVQKKKTRKRSTEKNWDIRVRDRSQETVVKLKENLKKF